MKQLTICGDSYYTDDSEWPNIHWTNKLTELLPDFKIKNLSTAGASNVLIRMQIDQALKEKPDYIVVSFTTSLRGLIRYNLTPLGTNLLERVYKPGQDKNKFNLVSFPYSLIDIFVPFSSSHSRILKEYVTECVDLDVMRTENYYIIESALYRLQKSRIPFSFSLGGFDHIRFTSAADSLVHYFDDFNQHKLDTNMWDYHNESHKTLRPFFHILDNTIQQKLANEVYQRILNEL
jgi:hypothetical protein